MASPSPVDSFFATFTGLKSVLYRNTSFLALILFPLTYQFIIVEFLIEEHQNGACNLTAKCFIPKDSADLNQNNRSTSREKTDAGNVSLILGVVEFFSMSLGTLILGLVADAWGRRKTLLASLLIVFIAGIASAFAFNSLTIFAVLRGLVGFATGGAFPITFILAAEYVSPNLRVVILTILWTAKALAFISLAGIAYVVEKRQILMLTMTLPLLLGVLLLIIVPESPRWVLLNSSTTDGANEAQGLLERTVTEEQKQSSKYKDCFTLWGSFYAPPDARKKEGRCFTFLRRKEARKITIVLGIAWLVIGMLYRGLNTSSIQLLKNFYANYAVRELVSLLGFAVFLLLAPCVGRRACTVIAMMFAGVFCLVFSVASNGFLNAEHDAVTAVIQLVGRVCVMVSLPSLSLYTIELFPTIVRCSGIGLVTSMGYLGASMCPLIMKLELLAHPVVPLGVMGCFSLTMGLVCHFCLPKTKGTTAETFDDGSEMARFQAWSPRVVRKRRKTVDSESGAQAIEEEENAGTDEDDVDEFAELRQSWEVSFDRVSRTSKWEMLSYEDAKTESYSFSVDQSLDEESHLLSEEEIDKFGSHVPSATWVLAYSTFRHGTSLKTLYHRLRDVETPIMMVVKDDNGYVFGVFSPMVPRVDPNFCGFGKSFFFTCKPRFKIYPSSGKNYYYMTGDTTSLAFGCSEGKFGLWLDSELYRGRSTACDTYNSEMLSSAEDFICLGVEVWTFA